MANKIRRLVSLSQEVDHKLDGINASRLIEELLEGHFNYLESDDLSLLYRKREELLNNIEIQNKKLDHVNNKVREVEESNKANEDSKKERESKEKESIVKANEEYNQIKEEGTKKEISFEEYHKKMSGWRERHKRLLEKQKTETFK